QLRADTVLDLLDGTGVKATPIGRPGVLELQIPLATAIGAGDQPGELAGYGPVVADVPRQIAQERQDPQWRFTVPSNGELGYQGLTNARPQLASQIPRVTRRAAARRRVSRGAASDIRRVGVGRIAGASRGDRRDSVAVVWDGRGDGGAESG